MTSLVFLFPSKLSHLILISIQLLIGFEHSTSACCGSGPYRAIPCGVKRRRQVCDDASKYVFWDTVHPSGAFNKIIAKTFCDGSFPNTDPFNLKQLGAIS